MKFTDAQIQSTGAFLVGELEKLDNQLYEPIYDATWSRDIDLREDVTIADEVTSFMLSNYKGGFGAPGSGKSWISQNSTTPDRVSVDVTKVTTPVTPWGMELSYSILELEKAMRVGRPIDVQKHDALRIKHQLDIDAQVYVGDAYVGVNGLLNNDSAIKKIEVESINASVKANEAVEFFNDLLNEAWKNTQYQRLPNVILVPPQLFTDLVSAQMTNIDKSVMNYVLENNLSRANGINLKILPCKWLADKNINSGKGRIVAYTKARDVVRFPLVQLQQLPPQHRGFNQIIPYYGALGAVEFVRPEMVIYGDIKTAAAASA